MLPYTEFLHRAGFTVVTYDSRGSGRSGGTTTMGVREPQDLASVVDFVASRPDVDRNKIGVLGFSLGGIAAITVAAHDTRIKAVVDDSAFTNGSEWILGSNWDVLFHPRSLFSPLPIWIAEQRAGIDVTTIRPGAEVAHISPRPVFVIQGASDDIEHHDATDMYAAAKQPKRLWMVPGAGHGQAVLSPGYGPRVVGFFERALKP